LKRKNIEEELGEKMLGRCVADYEEIAERIVSSKEPALELMKTIEKISSKKQSLGQLESAKSIAKETTLYWGTPQACEPREWDWDEQKPCEEGEWDWDIPVKAANLE
jgi:hypothetical protein